MITSDVDSFILSCFIEDEAENLKKQKHTTKRIYDRLANEQNFSGLYSSVRDAVRRLRVEHAIPPQSDIPYDPGEAVQYDWGETTVYLDCKKTKLNLFCARLCNSCDIIVKAYRTQDQETFLETQQRAFDFFGGVPRRAIFDNAKVAVKEGFGLYAKPQDKYLSFSAHYALL